MTAPYLKDMDALRAEIRARGWYTPTPFRVLAEFVLHLALTFGGGALFVLTEDPLSMTLGIILCTLGSLGIGTNAHTGSHGATFRHRQLDSIHTFLGYTLMLGVSASWWTHKHVHVHHRAPNVADIDADIDLAPIFAILEPQVRAARGAARRWYALQWLAIIPAIAFNGFSMVAQGIVFLLHQLSDRQTRRASHWIDLGVIGLHISAWLALAFVLSASPTKILALFMLRVMLLGYALFAAFAPAHMPLEAAYIAERPHSSDQYVRTVTAGTINFRTGPVGRLLCSGVEFQIEHHLFPRVSHVYYPRLAKLVRAYCQHHGYPYRTVGWGEGIRKALRVFRTPKPLITLESTTR